MANHPGAPTYPMQFGSAVPPRPIPARRPENMIYPGDHQPQNQFNRMLQGPVHAGSALPSEQFNPQGLQDSRMNFRMFQSKQTMGPGVGNVPGMPAAQHPLQNQQHPQQPFQGGPPTPYTPGWPGAAGNGEASTNAGAQFAMAGRVQNPIGTAAPPFGATGPMEKSQQQIAGVQPPPGYAMLSRGPGGNQNMGSNGANGVLQMLEQVLVNRLTTQPNDRATGTLPAGTLNPSDAPFQTSLSGSAFQNPRSDTTSLSSDQLAANMSGPAFTGPAAQSQQNRASLPPSARSNPQSLYHPSNPGTPSNTGDARSPARSTTVTPGVTQYPPLTESRDSLQVQIHAQQLYPHNPLPLQPPNMALHAPPGTHPTPAAQQLAMQNESAYRQQQMLSQRQHSRPPFSVPISAPIASSVAAAMPQQAQAPPNPAAQLRALSGAQSLTSAPMPVDAFMHPPSQPGRIFSVQQQPPPSNLPIGASAPPRPGSSTPAPSSIRESSQPPPPSLSRTTPAPMNDAQPSSSEKTIPAPSTGYLPSRSLIPAITQGPLPPVPAQDSSLQSQTSQGLAANVRPPFSVLPPPGLLSAQAAALSRPTSGFGTLKVLEFCSGIAKGKQECSVVWWKSLVQDHIHSSGYFEMTLWKVAESRKFHLDSAVLNRFFYRTFSCGVQKLNITFHNQQETVAADGSISVHVDASWVYTYKSGYSVALVGPFEVTMHPETIVNPSPGPGAPPSTILWRFTKMQFVATEIVKLINVEDLGPKRMLIPSSVSSSSADTVVGDNGRSGLSALGLPTNGDASPNMDISPTPTMLTSSSAEGRNSGDERWAETESMKLPPDPVNEYGIPQSLLVCLDLCDSAGSMSALLKYSSENSVGSIDALVKMAEMARTTYPELIKVVENRPPNRRRYLDGIKPATPTPMTTQTPKITHARAQIVSSPMQIDPRSSSATGQRAGNNNTSPKDSASDLSSLSSPPTAAVAKRKAAMMEQERSSSAADPPPSSSSSRRRTQTASSDTSSSTGLSTRSTRQQRKQSSPKIPTAAPSRPRRRGT